MAKTQRVNKLAPLKVKVDEKPKQTGDVIVLPVEGDYPQQYNEAAAIAAQAEELMKDLKERMLPEALRQLFTSNVQTPWEPAISVALKDDKGNTTRVSFTKKYAVVPVEEAEDLFRQLKVQARGEKPSVPADINDYIARTVTAQFDASVFLGPDGTVDTQRYEMFTSAIQAVADKLKVPNPLKIEATVAPLPSFHMRRWYDFDRDANVKISNVIKNQVSFVPCPNGTVTEE